MDTAVVADDRPASVNVGYDVDSSAGPSSRPSDPTPSIDLTGESDDEGQVGNAMGETALPPAVQAQSTSSPSRLPLGSTSFLSPASSAYPPTDGHLHPRLNAAGNPAFSAYAMNGQNGSPSVLAPPSASTFRPYYPPPSMPGWTSSVPSAAAGPSEPPRYHPQPSGGSSASSAIDLTSMRIPSPPPQPSEKKPICIGGIVANVVLPYPAPVLLIGAQPPEGSKEKYDVVPFHGAELLKVKLKYRQAGTVFSKHEPWNVVKRDCIQVATPGMTGYVGELDNRLADLLIPHVARGILRLEGFVQRLQPEAPQYQSRVNVLLFTLPSNVPYLEKLLTAANLYLLDPVPPYDPNRHIDRPPYINAHGSGEHALRLYQYAQQRMVYGKSSYELALAPGQLDKSKQIEVQRKQVDEVFKSLDNGSELEHSDPGPYIKTPLFDHQRKALTFLLDREQDSSALKKAKRYAQKRDEKRRKKGVLPPVAPASDDGGAKEGDGDEEGKGKDQDKEDNSRSMWERVRDDTGRSKGWKNKVTGEQIKGRKGEKPKEGKGAILADDMGLGKTLSVVSLIAATRRSALKWSKTKVESMDSVSDGEERKSDVKVSDIKTKVFGMPTPESDDESSAKGKKRKRDDKKDTRKTRIVRRSKATLLVCPMSTITNWEDQIKEHWDGQVEIIGGAAGLMPPKTVEKKWKPPKKDGEDSDSNDDDFETLKVYVYHGPSRRPDPDFIGDFDIVITSYNTLALEYARQGAVSGEDTPATPGETTTANSGDEVDVNGDASLNSRAVKPEVEAEIKAQEVADALRKSRKKSKTMKVGRSETSPLQAIDWFRVVLDEAHYIKTATTVASQASCDLQADRRIALSGTPIQNKIEDVWALFRFLRLSPVDDKECFNKQIANPCKFGEQIGVARLQLVMRCCTLRRTKDSTTREGVRILNLPPRKEMQLWLDLRDDERKVYDERASALKDTVEDLKGRNELGKNYAHVLQEVLRLRQICNHVDLAKSGAVEEDYDGTVMDYEVAVQGIERYGLNQARAVSVVAFLKDGDGAQCTTCKYDFGDYFPSMGLLGGPDEDIKPAVMAGDKCGKSKKGAVKAVLTKCLHLYCIKCFRDQVFADWGKKVKEATGRECTACNSILRIPADVVDVNPPDSNDGSTNEIEQQPKRSSRRKYVRPPGEKPNLSTKMQYLHDELLKLSKKNPDSPHYDPFNLDFELEEMDKDGKPFVTKSVVFSQWTTMLDRIGDMLDEANIKYARLDGTMTREERAKACELLRHDKKTEVLLVSTRAGGVGLNLTAASRCFLVDPYWNPSVESQAIDRIHRMGQTRPVIAVKLMINDSIEMRLDAIQKKKANLAQMSLKQMSRKELMAQKAEELASLFS